MKHKQNCSWFLMDNNKGLEAIRADVEVKTSQMGFCEQSYLVNLINATLELHSGILATVRDCRKYLALHFRTQVKYLYIFASFNLHKYPFQV